MAPGGEGAREGAGTETTTPVAATRLVRSRVIGVVPVKVRTTAAELLKPALARSALGTRSIWVPLPAATYASRTVESTWTRVLAGSTAAPHQVVGGRDQDEAWIECHG